MFQIEKFFFIPFLAIACGSATDTDAPLTVVSPLPEQLKECSGLIQLGNDSFIGLNDSGHPAELLLFKLGSTSAPQVINISGAGNHDWEELTMDEQYVYIGDIGNNTGTRKDLVIYRVRKEAILKDTEAKADEIFYTYPEQESFLPAKKHNFDCEAMVCVGDSLYLFTKNRLNYKTDLYSLPKIPGNYGARHLGQFDAQGLITGAAFRNSNSGNELALVGYTDKKEGYHPFIIYFDGVNGTRFFETSSNRFSFKGTQQTETILFFDERHVYISNEGKHGDQAFVYQVEVKK
jgi:hypothetical protein